jgi:predicted naringenin-chalcone synthase
MSFAILGLGTAVPPTTIDQAAAARIAQVVCCRTPEQQTWLPLMYNQTGIEKRHLTFKEQVVSDIMEGTRLSGSVFLPSDAPDDRGPTTAQRMRCYEADAGPLALQAARHALDQSGLAARELTHLVTISCTGFTAPGVDFELIEGLKLRPTTQRTHIGFMGCHAAINGMRVARAYTGSDPSARVLLCAVELCGLHYHYGWDPQKMVANAIFADGAAAVVGAPAERAPAGSWQVVGSGSCLLPNSREAMSWTIGEHGFEMTLSRNVPNLIRQHLRPWLESWLAEAGLRLGDVGSWAIHPGGPRIIDAVAATLQLAAEQTAAAREVLAQHGNMSSPTVLFILDHLRRQDAPRPCVALAFGPGLIAEAALLR